MQITNVANARKMSINDTTWLNKVELNLESSPSRIGVPLDCRRNPKIMPIAVKYSDTENLMNVKNVLSLWSTSRGSLRVTSMMCARGKHVTFGTISSDGLSGAKRVTLRSAVEDESEERIEFDEPKRSVLML